MKITTNCKGQMVIELESGDTLVVKAHIDQDTINPPEFPADVFVLDRDGPLGKSDDEKPKQGPFYVKLMPEGEKGGRWGIFVHFSGEGGGHVGNRMHNSLAKETCNWLNECWRYNR